MSIKNERRAIAASLHAALQNTLQAPQARQMARMARDARRDGLADLAEIRRQAERAFTCHSEE